MNKIFKKVLCATLATATLAGGAIAFGGCTTNRPEVEMQISFNGKTYTLEYQLFRKLAPNTVEHFLVLAETATITAFAYTIIPLPSGTRVVTPTIRRRKKRVAWFTRIISASFPRTKTRTLSAFGRIAKRRTPLIPCTVNFPQTV